MTIDQAKSAIRKLAGGWPQFFMRMARDIWGFGFAAGRRATMTGEPEINPFEEEVAKPPPPPKRKS